MKKSVGAIIYFKGKYLLQKRDNKKNIFFPDFWGVFGGSVDKNEIIRKAVLRELKEEITLDMNIEKKILTSFFKSYHFNSQRKRVYFECSFKTKKFKIKLNEGVSLKFFKINEIKKLKIIPWDLQALLYFDLFYIKKKKLLPQ